MTSPADHERAEHERGEREREERLLHCHAHHVLAWHTVANRITYRQDLDLYIRRHTKCFEASPPCPLPPPYSVPICCTQHVSAWQSP